MSMILCYSHFDREGGGITKKVGLCMFVSHAVLITYIIIIEVMANRLAISVSLPKSRATADLYGRLSYSGADSVHSKSYFGKKSAPIDRLSRLCFGTLVSFNVRL